MFSEKIIFVGVAISILCSLWYIKNIIYGEVRPNLISWFIWMLAPFIGTFLALKAGAGFTAFGIFMAGFGPLLVIIVSLFRRNVFWKINSFDVVCGIFSILALVLYVITNNLAISIIFVIVSDLLAYFPTFIKTYKYPETESSFMYLGGIINNIFALLIIKDWSFSIYAFSIYLITANIFELYFIYRKKIFKKSKIDS